MNHSPTQLMGHIKADWLDTVGKLTENLSGQIAGEMFGPGRRLCSNIMECIGEFLPAVEQLKKGGEQELFRLILSIHKKMDGIAGSDHFPEDSMDLNGVLKSGYTELEKQIAQLDRYALEVQTGDRIRVMRTDPFLIKPLKFFKSLAFHFSASVHRLRTIITRTIMKKELAPMAWHHQVPLWQLTRYYFRNRFTLSLVPLILKYFSINGRYYGQIKTVADEIYAELYAGLIPVGGQEEPGDLSRLKDMMAELERISSEMKGHEKAFAGEIIQIRPLIEKEMAHTYHRMGTIEFPQGKLAPGRINRQQKHIIATLKQERADWLRTWDFQFRDWKFDSSIAGIINRLLEDYFSTLEFFRKRVYGGVAGFLETFRELSEEAYNKFLGNDAMAGKRYREMSDVLRSYQEASSRQLIPVLYMIRSTGLRNRINQLIAIMERAAADLPDRKAIVRDFTPETKLRLKGIQHIRPAELMDYQITEDMSIGIGEHLAELDQGMEELRQNLYELNGIRVFGMESALDALSGRREFKEDDYVATLKGSKERSELKEKELTKKLDEIAGILETGLGSTVLENAGKIYELRENEKVLGIFVQLAKLKALRLTRKMGDSILQATSRFYRGIRNPLMISYTWTRNKLRFVSKKIGYTLPDGGIATELSDFLSATSTSLERLPFIYRRLYKIESLEEEVFFVERERENKMLSEALGSWKNGRYSPVALIGEKGSGASTLLTIFKKRLTDYKVIMITPDRRYYEPEDMMKFLGDRLDYDGIPEVESLASFLLGKSVKQVVILENLQYFYLRTVKGFSSLKALFELFSLTNSQVMWITSCTSYSWHYLSKTNLISSYFGYVINLESFSLDEIDQVIMKRHSISGFHLFYQPNKIQERSRQYRKVPADQKQEYLQKQYLMGVNRFAQGNVSLALVFWIRSTLEVRDRTILISSMYEPDYGFLNGLELAQIRTLHMIIIHDGLTLEEHSRVLRVGLPLSRMTLYQLNDDGILTVKNGVYLINPILYRQVVNMLKVKNFIH